jgi:hypothetical protein
VLHRTVTKKAVATEQLSVVRRDGFMYVFFRNFIKQFFYHPVEVLNGINLPVSQVRSFARSKCFFLLNQKLSTYDVIVQVFEYPVNAADARPLVRRLIRKCVRIMGFPTFRT